MRRESQGAGSGINIIFSYLPTISLAYVCTYFFYFFYFIQPCILSISPLQRAAEMNTCSYLITLQLRLMQKYIEKLKQNVFWGFYLSKQSEKANFYGDVINARQGQKCIWSGEEHFCPCRASCFLDIRTQGVALGYVLVALPGRFFNRILVEYFFSREENNFLSGGKTFWVGSNGATSRLKWGNESAQYYFRHMVLHFFRSSRFHPERIPKASRRHPEGLQ